MAVPPEFPADPASPGSATGPQGIPTIVVPFHTDDSLPAFELPIRPDAVLAPKLPENGSSWRRMAVLYDSVAREVAELVTGGARPVVFSGDCTTSLGIVAGIQRAFRDRDRVDVGRLGIVWFDAHGDVQTPQTTASGYLGGMPLRMLLGTGDAETIDSLGLEPVAEQDTVLVDARDLDPPEAEFLASSQVAHLGVGDVKAGRLPAGPLYLHIDVDVIDPEQMPGLLYPARGGPSLQAVAYAVREVLATGRVVAVGVGCTWHPERPDAAEAVQPLVNELLA